MNRLFANAERCGSPIERTGYQYNEDDNTHTPYTYTELAWACRIELNSQIRQALDLYEAEEKGTAKGLFEEMFGTK